MSGVKNTPGPWLAAAKPSSVVGWPVVAAPMGQVICDVAIINKKPEHISDGEFSAYYAQVEANARLIAAAPDLLEACVEAAKTFRRYEALHLDKGTVDGAQKAAANASHAKSLEAIIARARGEQDGGGHV